MASLVGSIIGSGQQSGDDAQALAAQQAALAAIQNINVPDIAEQQVQLAQEKSAGQLNPEMEGTASEGNTGLANISTDPRLRSAQMQALQSLQQQGQSGLTASDRLNLNNIIQQQQQASNSANQAVMQNMAQKGMGGSGSTLAAMLANNQNSANNGLTASLNVGAQAQQNALNATAQSGQLGSQLEGQQYGEASNAANAQDAINRFNAQNQQQVMGQNTQYKNAAQQANLTNAQNISNTNTNTQNQQEMYNKGLYQQQFSNNLAKGSAAAGESNSLAGTYQNAGQNAYKDTMGIANAANQSGSQLASLFYNGGMVQHFDEGGTVMPSSDDWAKFTGANDAKDLPQDSSSAGPSQLASKLQAFFKAGMPQQAPAAAPSAPAPQAAPQPNAVAALLSKLKPAAPTAPQLPSVASNFGAPQLQMPQIGQQQTPPPALALGGQVNYQTGGRVKGPEIVPGDSPKNDVVDAKLSAGEIVVPKEVAQHDNPDVITAFIRGVKTANKKAK